MKKIILLIAFFLCLCLVSGIGNPYPLYGITNPNTKVTFSSSLGTKSTVSDNNGYYQIELDSNYKKGTLSVNGCSKDLTLPVSAGYNVDMKCNIPPLPVTGGIGAGVIAVGVGAYVLFKKHKAKKVKPIKIVPPKK